MTWIDEHSPEVETEQERIEREQHKAECDEAEKRVAELEVAAATEPACNCETARGAYGHWLSCERCR